MILKLVTVFCLNYKKNLSFNCLDSSHKEVNHLILLACHIPKRDLENPDLNKKLIPKILNLTHPVF